MSQKLAVLFPGMGYTNDKPLLYYSRKMLEAEGYETRLLTFSGFPKKDKNNEKKMKKALEIVKEQSAEQMAEVDWAQYTEVLFVGKSIGTAGAAWMADKLQIPVRQVVFTPLEMTFAWPLTDAIVFTGTADPWVPQGRIPEICAEKNIPCHSIAEGNHSLETGDWCRDLETVQKVITEVSRFVRKG